MKSDIKQKRRLQNMEAPSEFVYQSILVAAAKQAEQHHEHVDEVQV